MLADPFFYAISGLALSMGGVFALITVLDRWRHPQPWNEAEGLRAVLELCLGAMALALLPPFLGLLEVDRGIAAVWLNSAGTTFLLLRIVLVSGRVRSLRAAKVGPRFPLMIWTFEFAVPGALALGLGLNTLLYRSLAAYACLLLWLLIASATQLLVFVRVLVRRVQQDQAAGGWSSSSEWASPRGGPAPPTG